MSDEITQDDLDAARDEGYESGYEEGKSDGYEDGQSDGYDSGYQDGQSDADTYEYEMGQYKALIEDDLADVENELYLLRDLREANPDLQRVFERVQRIIKDAEQV